MIIHNGKYESAFVQGVAIGDVPVWEVDYGETKIYPDEVTGVQDAVVDVSPGSAPFLDVGSDEWIYWVHAMDATRKEQSSDCNMKVQIGGKWYSLNGEVDGLPRCFFNERTGELTFGELDAPPLEGMAPGGKILFTAHIPERQVTLEKPWQDGGHQIIEQYLPWLPDMRLEFGWGKGQKKACAAFQFVIYGVPTKRYSAEHSEHPNEPINEYCSGKAQKNGHCRGYYTGNADLKTGKAWIWDAYWFKCKNMHYPGDTGWEADMWTWNSCYGFKIIAYYPAFDKQWELPLMGVLYSQVER